MTNLEEIERLNREADEAAGREQTANREMIRMAREDTKEVNELKRILRILLVHFETCTWEGFPSTEQYHLEKKTIDEAEALLK